MLRRLGARYRRASVLVYTVPTNLTSTSWERYNRHDGQLVETYLFNHNRVRQISFTTFNHAKILALISKTEIAQYELNNIYSNISLVIMQLSDSITKKNVFKILGWFADILCFPLLSKQKMAKMA